MTRAFSSLKNGFQKVSHVIFDLDGLLLDSETIYTQSIKNVLAQYGKEYTHELNRRVLGSPANELAEFLTNTLAIPLTAEEFLHAKFIEQEKLGLFNAELMPGAEKFVKHLHKHKVPIAVATSSTRESYDLKITKHKEIFALFNHKVTGGSDPEVKNGKPSPDIFLVCASRFSDKPHPSKCLVFEDAPNGVTAGISAGMQTVMIPDMKLIAPEFQKHATLVVGCFDEFKPELFGLPPY